MAGKCAVSITNIKVVRGEGPIELTGEWEFTGPNALQLANNRLKEIARSAPKIGVDKTDVVVDMDDGRTFKSRHDISYLDTDMRILEHIRRHQDLIAACGTPEKGWKHIDPEKLAGYCKFIKVTDEDVLHAQENLSILDCLLNQ